MIGTVFPLVYLETMTRCHNIAGCEIALFCLASHGERENNLIVLL